MSQISKNLMFATQHLGCFLTVLFYIWFN